MYRSLLFLWFTFATLVGPAVCQCAACPLAFASAGTEKCQHSAQAKCSCCEKDADSSSSEPTKPCNSCPCKELSAIDATPAEGASFAIDFDLVSTLDMGFVLLADVPAREFEQLRTAIPRPPTDVLTLCHLLRC